MLMWLSVSNSWSAASDQFTFDQTGLPAVTARTGLIEAVVTNHENLPVDTVVENTADTASVEPRPHGSTALPQDPDWSGVWRDTGILFVSQAVAAGVIYVMPESFSGWSSEEKRNGFKKYTENVVSPVVDKDDIYINYVLHPYWGATYYTRARERGLDKPASFIYSALISSMYEFGVECFFEKPSIKDLLVTPIGGSLLGALIFEPWRESIKRKPELAWHDHAALVLTDPVGVLSVGFEKMFGIKSTVVVNYSVPQRQNRSAGVTVASKDRRIGVGFQFLFN